MMWSHHQLPLPLLGGMYQHVLGINSLIRRDGFLGRDVEYEVGLPGGHRPGALFPNQKNRRLEPKCTTA